MDIMFVGASAGATEDIIPPPLCYIAEKTALKFQSEPYPIVAAATIKKRRGTRLLYLCLEQCGHRGRCRYSNGVELLIIVTAVRPELRRKVCDLWLW